MSQLRKVPSTGFPYGVFEDPRNPLVMIYHHTGEVLYSKIIDDKRGMLLEFKEAPFKDSPQNYKLIFIWQGKASSDVFEITQEHLDKLLDY